MSETRWLVELLLPSGTFLIRAVTTDRTAAYFDGEIEVSACRLMAIPQKVVKPALPRPPGLWTHHVEEEPEPEPPQPQSRLLMAHTLDAERAKEIASDLRAIFPHTPLPWSAGTRQAFESYLRSKMDGAVPQPASTPIRTGSVPSYHTPQAPFG